MEKTIASQQGKVRVVLNPAAGTSTPDEVRTAIEQAFGSSGRPYDIYETKPDDDLGDYLEQARNEDDSLVIAAGGDGTVSLVASQLAGSGIPIGILPTGSANVLALELGLPQDVQEAANVIAGTHQVRELDLMQFGERHYVLQVGVGIDSLMVRDTSRQAKRILGRAAYLVTLFGKFIGYRSRRFTIMADGRRLRPRAWQIVVANAGTLGTPPFRWGPDINLSDGKVDVCIFNVRTPFSYVRQIARVLLGQHKNDSHITYVQVKERVSIAADHPLPIQADGEIIEDTPIQIDVVPQGAKVIVPLETESQNQ